MALSLGNFFLSVQSLSDQKKKSTKKILPFPTCLCKASRDHLVKLSGTNLLSETSYGHFISLLSEKTTPRNPDLEPGTFTYPSSHNNGSGRWVPPKLVSFHLGSFSTSMIMGERVDFRGFFCCFFQPFIFVGRFFGFRWRYDLQPKWDVIDDSSWC